MSSIQQTCKCGTVYFAREADLKRGWGKSCSKRCAALKRTKQERARNHKLAPASLKYRNRPEELYVGSRLWNELSDDWSWDAHKNEY
jgi:hypothetical protein